MGLQFAIKKAIIKSSMMKRKKKEGFDPVASELFTLPPDADAFFNNSYFFTAHDMAGASLVFRLGLRGGDKSEVWFFYRDMDIYTSDPVELYPKDSCPLTLECIEPGKKWEIHYKSILKDQATGKSMPAEFTGSFTGTAEIFDFFFHMNPKGTAAGLAVEKWTKMFFVEIDKNNQRHYEQRGMIEGTLNLNGKEKRISLPAARDHSFGHRSWAYMNLHILLLIIISKGETFNLSLVGYPVVKNLCVGYTDFGGGRIACMVKYRIEGDTINGGKGAENCRYICTMDDGSTYDILARREGAVVYHFENGGFEFFEGFGSFDVNGEKCRGTIEYGYNGDRTRWE
jgi:hypothetical protein